MEELDLIIYIFKFAFSLIYNYKLYEIRSFLVTAKIVHFVSFLGKRRTKELEYKKINN